MELNDQLKDIMKEMEKKGDVKAVFGEPIKEGNITIIPVAAFAVMGGGGAGEGEPKMGEEGKMKGKGMGMGYGKKAHPVGYIKIENNQATFEPIADWQKLLPVLVGIMGISLVVIMKLLVWGKMKKIKECTCK